MYVCTYCNPHARRRSKRRAGFRLYVGSMSSTSLDRLGLCSFLNSHILFGGLIESDLGFPGCLEISETMEMA
jgi:hypothetical protein